MKQYKIKTMTRYLLIFALLLWAVSSSAQSKNDQAIVLQKCIAMPQVNQFYQLDKTGIPVSIYAITTSVHLEEGLDVSYRGRKVTFVTQAQMEAIKADSYINFVSFKLATDKASVTFDYFHKSNTGNKVIRLDVELNKVGGDWIISETKETGW